MDQSGDAWQEFVVLHPKFKLWMSIQPYFNGLESVFLNFLEIATKDDINDWFLKSPWYGSCANDINWEKRVETQAIIQRFTTNAISSTINLPNDVAKEEVAKIYWQAWELGLKGVTV